jgi:serine/threonine protein kinase
MPGDPIVDATIIGTNEPVSDETRNDDGTALSTTTGSVNNLPFTRIGHYEIIAHLGSGGMGEVYLGYERELDRKVAIKVLPARFAAGKDFVRRFRAEAAAAAKLVHPNIVQIYYIGEDAGTHFFAMEYVEGESLARLLPRRKRLEIGATLHLIEQILEGLSAAHERGMVHRDIKPGNILVDYKAQRVLLTDFGLVKLLDSAQSLQTSAGTILGTAEYLSPEQATANNVDTRSDLYSIGIMLYQMLSGRLPFECKSLTGLIYKHVHEPPPRLIDSSPEIPHSLARIVHKLLEKDPAKRFQSADELLDALRQIPVTRLWPEEKGSISVPRILRGKTNTGIESNFVSPRRNHKNRIFAALAGLAAVVLTIFLVLSSRPEQSTDFDRPATQHVESSGVPGAASNAATSAVSIDVRRPGPSNSERSVADNVPHSVREFAGHTHEICTLDVSPDGSRLASGDRGGTLIVWNAQDGSPIQRIDGPGVPLRRVAFFDGSDSVATCSDDPVIRLWDIGTGDLRTTLRGHDDVVHSVRPVPEKRQLVSAGRDSTVIVWDATTGAALRRFGKATNPEVLPASPTLSDLLKLNGHVSWIREAAPLDDGRLLVTAGNDVLLFVWDLETGALIDRLPGHQGNVFSLQTASGTHDLYSVSDDRQILSCDTSTFQIRHRWRFPEQAPPLLAIAPGGSLGACLDAGGAVSLRELSEAATTLGSIPPGASPAASLQFLAGGAELVVGCQNGMLTCRPVASISR